MRVLQQDLLARAGRPAAHRDVLRGEPGQGGHRVSRVRLCAVEARRRAAALARAREPVVRAPGLGPTRVRSSLPLPPRAPSFPPISGTGRPERGGSLRAPLVLVTSGRPSPATLRPTTSAPGFFLVYC